MVPLTVAVRELAPGHGGTGDRLLEGGDADVALGWSGVVPVPDAAVVVVVVAAAAEVESPAEVAIVVVVVKDRAGGREKAAPVRLGLLPPLALLAPGCGLAPGGGLGDVRELCSEGQAVQGDGGDVCQGLEAPGGIAGCSPGAPFPRKEVETRTQGRSRPPPRRPVRRDGDVGVDPLPNAAVPPPPPLQQLPLPPPGGCPGPPLGSGGARDALGRGVLDPGGEAVGDPDA